MGQPQVSVMSNLAVSTLLEALLSAKLRGAPALVTTAKVDVVALASLDFVPRVMPRSRSVPSAAQFFSTICVELHSFFRKAWLKQSFSTPR